MLYLAAIDPMYACLYVFMHVSIYIHEIFVYLAEMLTRCGIGKLLLW